MDVEIKVKVAVTFPIYLTYDGAGDTIARFLISRRVESDGSVLMLWAQKLDEDSETQFTVQQQKLRNVKSTLAAMMNHRCNSFTNDPTEFEALRQEILAALTG